MPDNSWQAEGLAARQSNAHKLTRRKTDSAIIAPNGCRFGHVQAPGSHRCPPSRRRNQLRAREPFSRLNKLVRTQPSREPGMAAERRLGDRPASIIVINTWIKGPNLAEYSLAPPDANIDGMLFHTKSRQPAKL